MSNQTELEQLQAALATFAEWFVTNYPGPDTIIHDPNWHAPRIFRAVEHALRMHKAAIEAGPKCKRCGDTGWLDGDPVRGISDEPCGCDENWEE